MVAGFQVSINGRFWVSTEAKRPRPHRALDIESRKRPRPGPQATPHPNCLRGATASDRVLELCVRFSSGE